MIRDLKGIRRINLFFRKNNAKKTNRGFAVYIKNFNVLFFENYANFTH